jgi:hypothetical protein
MNQSTAHDHAPTRPGTLAGTLLCRLLVPAWILAGAAFKLWERNPQLLPKPVTDVTDFVFVRTLGIPRETYLEPAMRFMIGFEIMAALLMVVAPVQAARALGISMLSLFCIILGVLLASGAASCGCFGASGPSPAWMLGIDGALLLGMLVLRPRGRRLPPAEAGRKVASVMFVPLLVGLGIAYGVPQRAAVVLDDGGKAPPTNAAADSAPTPTPTPTPAPTPAPTGPGLQTPANRNPVTSTPTTSSPAAAGTTPVVPTASAPWPPMPATAKPWYAPEFEGWKGKRLDSQELMLLVQRPLPADLNAGRHHVVFMREDCEHCHELLLKYFSGKLGTPVTSIAIPDATGELLENPCTECGKAVLPKGITYVFSTPVLLTVQDGMVVGVCVNADDAELVRAAINAK